MRVVAGRVGGGFGGKQEMLTEDIVTLAALRLRRPVKLEYTRAEQFHGATTRHPFTIRIKAGARRDGTLTAVRMRVVADTGAYGNHGPAVMFHSVGESFAVYRAPHKKVDAYSVYTNAVPAGAFRGYGLGQVTFAVESVMDELARRLDMDPLAFREKNVIGPGRACTARSARRRTSTSPRTDSTSASPSCATPSPGTAARRTPPRAGSSDRARAWR